MIRVSTKFERPDAALVEQLRAFSSATIHEAQGRLGALDSVIKPVDHRMSLCGPAFTVQCAPRDNLMLQTAIAYARPGDVVVVSAGAYEEAGSFGDVLANACQAKGLGGLITDTGVRDTEDLRALGFPVFSRSVSIKGTVKETVGPMCEPVTIGGVLVRPGDVMRADADGVVVVRREDAAAVTTASQERVDAEAGYISAYRAGRTVIEMCGLEPLLASKGLMIED
ncbi:MULTISPECIES: 4-carboxy-4-hydroxy-2-oxoadipate aldolase/oxaloacetate decarboxylase [Streptomyces]|jgi:4-hydroxy-4-methyl-2-oxoglutarate aldolase|uniref:Putative 4-hydroxy-4-methyl-2-oxoglutarate aldolase n=1 Tax=Streptomyces caelestis TaxID=36816 RepID=A0A7W9HB42_9ACTN|nr:MULTISPECIES: 4-carboxy-4-hydroxy-2-oxoadipate aldolase/oxaloacetate decarboxylase [Streptomyces]MBB5798751.1 4-hydroxy-4-methyl-2-oxoglutarate aldolase [Streptomyces caelestis]MDQ0957320.1 4-hydroxy-4-methyl-2-oxoglutarate aldolase [Streptomyces sp. B4I13]GGW85098.1 methyltransferase [Streptomyces caelestis]